MRLTIRRRVGLGAAGAVLLAPWLTGAAQAASVDWGSIAYSESKQVVAAGGGASRSEAINAALKECRAKGGAADCWALIWFHNGVGAFARASDGDYGSGYAWSDNVDEAMKIAGDAAIKVCKEYGGTDCEVIFGVRTSKVLASGAGGSVVELAWPLKADDPDWKHAAVVNGYRGAVDHKPGQSPNNYASLALDLAKCKADKVDEGAGKCTTGNSDWLNVTNAKVYSPVTGKVAWTDRKCVGGAIDVEGTPGYRIAMWHIDGFPATGTPLVKGETFLGSVSAKGCGFAGHHIHMGLYKYDGSDKPANRTATPFEGRFKIGKCDLTDDKKTVQQWLGLLVPCK